MPDTWAITVPRGYVVSRWRIGAPIATGSWGSVYEALSADGKLATDPVAVKFLPTGTVTQRQLSHLAEMARRERDAYRRLRHPRLLQLIESVVVEDGDRPELDGAVALVTERARESLADVIARAAGGPVRDAPRILAEICEGLAHIHKSGWVHGDLKPSNILLMPDGSVRLADFGLSVELEGTHGYLPPVGTSDYVPPERWSEMLTDRGIAVRASADLWALGAIACLLLAGHLPFPGATARTRAAAAAEYAGTGAPAPRVAGLPAEWQRLILACLAPDHARRRHWTAARLQAALRGLAANPAPARRRRPLLPRVLLPRVLRPRRAPLPRAVRARVPRARVPRARVQIAAFAAVVAALGAAASLWLTSETAPDYARYFRAGASIPPRFQPLIVRAGTMCHAPGVSPALVAAILRAESGFRPDMIDPATRSYGIAGWTPSVLWHYTNPPVENLSTRSALNPAIAIPALGRYLCQFAPTLLTVPGSHAVNLAAAYQSADYLVRKYQGVPPPVRRFAGAVRRYLHEYLPAGQWRDRRRPGPPAGPGAGGSPG